MEEIRSLHASGRPVLVGAVGVEESARLAAFVRGAGVGNGFGEELARRVERDLTTASIYALWSDHLENTSVAGPEPAAGA